MIILDNTKTSFNIYFLNVYLAERPPDFDADIVILMDASRFVTRENFIKEKDFVKSLAKFLNVAPGNSRAALVVFGTSPYTEIRFNDYRTLRDFNGRVDQARAVGGSRRMDYALQEATKVLRAGKRRGVPHVVVLVTTGKQSRSEDSIPLDDALGPLEKLGAHTFVVAIGHDPDTSTDVLRVPSINDLPSRVYGMAKQIKSSSGMKLYFCSNNYALNFVLGFYLIRKVNTQNRA